VSRLSRSVYPGFNDGTPAPSSYWMVGAEATAL
jgi:hypothetical protein